MLNDHFNCFSSDDSNEFRIRKTSASVQDISSRSGVWLIERIRGICNGTLKFPRQGTEDILKCESEHLEKLSALEYSNASVDQIVTVQYSAAEVPEIVNRPMLGASVPTENMARQSQMALSFFGSTRTASPLFSQGSLVASHSSSSPAGSASSNPSSSQPSLFRRARRESVESLNKPDSNLSASNIRQTKRGRHS